MTSYDYYTDYTLLEKGNCWRVIHAKCKEYMVAKGNEQAKELFAQIVEDALRNNNRWNQLLSAENKRRLNNCAKFFVVEVQKSLGKKIFEACAKKVSRMNEDEVAKVIDKIGDVEELYEQTAAGFKRNFSSIVRIYSNLFIYTYLDDGQDEVFEMLVLLPAKLLKAVSDELLDTWDYSLSVRNGKLVVYDHD